MLKEIGEGEKVGFFLEHHLTYLGNVNLYTTTILLQFNIIPDFFHIWRPLLVEESTPVLVISTFDVWGAMKA